MPFVLPDFVKLSEVLYTDVIRKKKHKVFEIGIKSKRKSVEQISFRESMKDVWNAIRKRRGVFLLVLVSSVLPFVNNCLDFLVRTNIPLELQVRHW